MIKKRIICAIIAVILLSTVIITFVINSSSELPKLEASKQTQIASRIAQKSQVKIDEKTAVVESDSLKLNYNIQNMTVEISDKKNGYIWKSYFNKEDLDKEPNLLWEQNIRSLLDISYIDSTKKSNDIQNKNNLNEMNKATIEKIDNGFSINFLFQMIKISVKMNFQIIGEELILTIPEDGVKESGKFNIVSLTAMPYFGSAKDSDDGYFFYPNGPGEIFKFKPKSQRLNSVKGYELPIYDNFNVDLETKHNVSVFQKEKIPVMMPLFGVKNSNNAFLTIIENGDANAAINVTPGGVSVSANRISTTFFYRHKYSIESSGLSVSGGMSAFPLAQMYDENLIEGERKVSYKFLRDENANYSAMARAARENFIARDLMKPEITDEKMPLALDLFMGISKPQMIFDQYIKMTSFEQAEEIVNNLKEDNVDNVYLNLLGWGKAGYNSFSLNQPVSMTLGGKQGMKSLAKLCAENKYKLTAQVNLTDIKKGYTKFSAISEPARDQNNFIYQDLSEKYMLFAPSVSLQKSKDLAAYLKKENVNGIVFEQLGSTIYDDFNRKNISRRTQTMNYWDAICKESVEQLGTSGAVGGNAYVLKNAKIVKDIPSNSSNILFSDKTVPFYQIMLHGSVFYTQSPYNLFYDEKQQALKLIEYGYIPSFELTYESASKLGDTTYNALFTSQFKNWREKISKVYEEFSANFQDIWKKPILSHEEIDKNVYKVTYEGGTEIYVNYNETKYENSNIVIDPVDYLIKR